MKKFHNLINKDIYFWHILQYKIYVLGIVLYRIRRHPIYTGLTGVLFGSMLLGGFGVWELYFIVRLIAVIIKITSEERLLKETFGEQYIRYQHHVPQLIPGKNKR